ncbi:MAG TPA: hypothetical protein VFS93_08680, partial [Terrimesophilobacter sp.]|nr:hypothetical protein [Terrimesophilobacter sp.]
EATEATTGATPDGLSLFAIPEDAAGEPGVMAFEDVGPVSRWRRINPWFFVLWALGLAFVLAGAAVMSFVVEWVNSPQQQAGFGFASSVLMQSTLWGAPMLIVLGLATITSTIVILAARWHRP